VEEVEYPEVKFRPEDVLYWDLDKFNISKKVLVARIFMHCHKNLNFNILVT
jgi:hypothetical protein